ncbi:helix-turn-helix domain-containing protein [Actinoplanes sp. NPDC051513]|uniref:helix-turn-helix domain-containing protein n=1 Tax=Actinoplanes sp. NPDC051513 TaxID=3363908 RepID=UPI0037B961D7
MRALGHHVARQVVSAVSVDEKPRIVLSVLSGEMTIAEAARQEQDQRAVGQLVEAAVHRCGKASLVEGGRIVGNPRESALLELTSALSEAHVELRV